MLLLKTCIHRTTAIMCNRFTTNEFQLPNSQCSYASNTVMYSTNIPYYLITLRTYTLLGWFCTAISCIRLVHDDCSLDPIFQMEHNSTINIVKVNHQHVIIDIFWIYDKIKVFRTNMIVPSERVNFCVALSASYILQREYSRYYPCWPPMTQLGTWTRLPWFSAWRNE